MDAWLLKIVAENWMSIYLILTLLKGIAIITPSATDDRIISLFSSVYNSLRSGEAPKTLEDK